MILLHRRSISFTIGHFIHLFFLAMILGAIACGGSSQIDPITKGEKERSEALVKPYFEKMGEQAAAFVNDPSLKLDLGELSESNASSNEEEGNGDSAQSLVISAFDHQWSLADETLVMVQNEWFSLALPKTAIVKSDLSESFTAELDPYLSEPAQEDNDAESTDSDKSSASAPPPPSPSTTDASKNKEVPKTNNGTDSGNPSTPDSSKDKDSKPIVENPYRVTYTLIGFGVDAYKEKYGEEAIQPILDEGFAYFEKMVEKSHEILWINDSKQPVDASRLQQYSADFGALRYGVSIFEKRVTHFYLFYILHRDTWKQSVVTLITVEVAPEQIISDAEATYLQNQTLELLKGLSLTVKTDDTPS